jgi:hypothetical protein
MLDIRYIVGAMLVSLALVIIGIRLFGVNDARPGVTIAGKPALEHRIAPPSNERQITVPAAAPSAETTGSIGSTRSIPAEAMPQTASKATAQTTKPRSPARARSAAGESVIYSFPPYPERYSGQ